MSEICAADHATHSSGDSSGTGSSGNRADDAADEDGTDTCTDGHHLNAATATAGSGNGRAANGRGSTGHCPGTATTGHGYSVPAHVAARWAGEHARIILILLSKTKRIEAYSSIHRIFTEQQRLAMMARDRGCSYPGCDASIFWTEAHHVHDFKDTNKTTVDDGTP